MTELEKVFNHKITENGDPSFKSTGNKLLDLFFMSSYYSIHPEEIRIGQSDTEKLFAMFMRDPRHGMGLREYGRMLLHRADVSAEDIVKCGRFDDLYLNPYVHGIKRYRSGNSSHVYDYEFIDKHFSFYREALNNGSYNARKWAPRFSSKHERIARQFAAKLGMSKQLYGHFIKLDSTTESRLSRKQTEYIDFEHTPSQALLKYYNRFATGLDTKERFETFLEGVKKGDKKLNISTTNVYDVFKNKFRIDPDLFFNKLEKISGSWLPVVDTSGSMDCGDDLIGKAMAIGHYLAKCSTYCPNQVVSFSSNPHLITLGELNNDSHNCWPASSSSIYDSWQKRCEGNPNSEYLKEVASIYTGDCSNTDLGKLMRMLTEIKQEFPEYLVIMSDMEFDQGSAIEKDELMKMWRGMGANTKIVWWNLNDRNKTCPETDEYGNIFMSGYDPTMLKFLDAKFDGVKFLEKLLEEYKNNINK